MVQSVAAVLSGCFGSAGRQDLVQAVQGALAHAVEQSAVDPLLTWLTAHIAAPDSPSVTPPAATAVVEEIPTMEGTPRRRHDDHPGGKTMVRVEQDKIDRLMSLIGEMVIAKNALPFLAGRAENVYGSRELSREIKAQHGIINRIAEEMQDAIMQVRMMPVSTVFQRFPRLVRDLSRKLGKEVDLVLEGVETEADKNIVEALADPLVHIVRNSLDHGIELPAVRRAAGKDATGKLVIRASQDSGRVLIDISDDGKGIDPEIVKRKAFDKGIIDQATRDRISNQEAVNLVFAAGFSTADQISDLSGRGVGMDVVRTAIEKIGGTVSLHSKQGEGTQLRLSLPMSMAVTNVMVVKSNRQLFGVPMDAVLETVRLPRANIRGIKNRKTTVQRNRIMPLHHLNELMAVPEPQVCNADDEHAVLVVEVKGNPVGLVVDDFRGTIDIILKPMNGILGSLPGYAGSALLGDGSILMVLNPKELISWA
jgi:two-component system chemotaxis sensor kinase CheA